MKKVLFFGEIFPKSINGVSIANLTNLEFLKEIHNIDIIIEKKQVKEHEKISLNKFFSIIGSLTSIVYKSLKNNYDYFYLVFSLSLFGAIKTLLSIICYKLFNHGKVILHLHRGDFLKRFYKNKLSKLITKSIFKLTDKLIVLSEVQKKEMSVFKSLNIEILYNTVDSELYLRERKIENKTFIFISNYLLDKGIIDLLEVFKDLIKQYTHISLETYGDFVDEELKSRILSYSGPSIIINNIITGEEKKHKLCTSDCLILPSWNEGQPIIILEAMSVGLPVISTNVGLIPDLIGPNYMYLANPKDQDSLKKLLIEFINSNENDVIANKLRSKYFEKYSREKHKIRLFEIFT